MSETRTKVYQWQAELERDEADAVAAGWRIKRREPWDNGTFRVTYEKDGRRFGWAEVAMTAVIVVILVAWLGSPR